MATYQILYWFDIPVQVKAAIGRNRRTVPLTDRFSEAVDAAAMASGLIGSDAYTEQFRWGDAQERDGEPEVFLTQLPGQGYTFEAQEVMRCLRAGALESPLVPWASTLGAMRTLDRWLAAVAARRG